MTVEGTGAVVAEAGTLAMTPADSGGNGGGGLWQQQTETEAEAAVGTDNYQTENGSDSGGNGDHGDDGGDGNGDGSGDEYWISCSTLTKNV